MIIPVFNDKENIVRLEALECLYRSTGLIFCSNSMHFSYEITQSTKGK